LDQKNNDHGSPVFSLGPEEDADFDSVWSACSATSLFMRCLCGYRRPQTEN